MRATEAAELNRRSYDVIAQWWDEARASFYGREQHYVDALLDGVAPGAAVLDLGCGTGRPIAQYIVSRAMALTGVDQSIRQLEIARSRLPGATWIHATIEECVADEALRGRFAAIVCHDALFHIPRAAHETLVQRFAALLQSGGRLMVTCGGSPHPAFTDTMFGETFFYDSHPPERMLEILARAGFVPIVSEFLNVPVPGGDKGRYVFVGRLT